MCLRTSGFAAVAFGTDKDVACDVVSGRTVRVLKERLALDLRGTLFGLLKERT